MPRPKKLKVTVGTLWEKSLFDGKGKPRVGRKMKVRPSRVDLNADELD